MLRGKDATEDDEWGVQPDKGLKVELDEETIVDLAKRWREASYPSLTTPDIKDNTTQNSPSEDTSGTKNSDSKTTDTNEKKTAGNRSDSADKPQNSDSRQPEFPQPESDGSGDRPDAVSAEPDQKTGLELDPQLRRAVEYLKQQSSGDIKQPTTA